MVLENKCKDENILLQMSHSNPTFYSDKLGKQNLNGMAKYKHNKIVLFCDLFFGDI